MKGYQAKIIALALMLAAFALFLALFFRHKEAATEYRENVNLIIANFEADLSEEFLQKLRDEVQIEGAFFNLAFAGLALASMALGILVLAAKGQDSADKVHFVMEQDSSHRPKGEETQGPTADSEEVIQRKAQEIAQKILEHASKPTRLQPFAEALLGKLAKAFNLVQGICFVKERASDSYTLAGTYAFFSDRQVDDFRTGEGIAGQVVKNKESLFVENVPENYVTILSGLGNSSPRHMLIFPILHGQTVVALVETASFEAMDQRLVNRVIELCNDTLAAALVDRFGIDTSLPVEAEVEES